MKFYVNYNYLDLEGYCTGVGGLVSYDYKTTHNEDVAFTFDTREEAEAWCANAERYGWDTFRVKFEVWSYDE